VNPRLPGSSLNLGCHAHACMRAFAFRGSAWLRGGDLGGKQTARASPSIVQRSPRDEKLSGPVEALASLSREPAMAPVTAQPWLPCPCVHATIHSSSLGMAPRTGPWGLPTEIEPPERGPTRHRTVSGEPAARASPLPSSFGGATRSRPALSKPSCFVGAHDGQVGVAWLLGWRHRRLQLHPAARRGRYRRRRRTGTTAEPGGATTSRTGCHASAP
jgi:hypothetical protein